MQRQSKNSPAIIQLAVTNRVLVNIAELAAEAGSSDDELATIASSIAESTGGEGIRQLFVDVTILVMVGGLSDWHPASYPWDFGSFARESSRRMARGAGFSPPS